MEAGLGLFCKVGLDAVSLEEVAETAGYSRGAFYSNFASKDELIVAVVEREIEQANRQLREMFAQEMAPQERLAIARAFYIGMGGDLRNCSFWIGVRLYAVRNGGVREKIAQLLRSHYSQVAEFIRVMYEELGKEPPASTEVLTIGLISQAQGLTLSLMVDPDLLSAEQTQQALGVFFDRLIVA